MSKILIFNVPQTGHLNPSLALTQELIKKGEQVIYYEDDQFKEVIEATGANFRSSKVTTLLSRLTGINGMPQMLIEFPRIIDRLVPQVQADKPDYVIYDSMCLWGRILAQILKVPAIRLSTTHAFSKSTFTPTQIAVEMAPPIKYILPLLQRSLNQISAEYSLAQLSIEELFSQPEMLDIVFVPKNFQLDGNSFADTFKFVGPSMGRQEVGLDDFPFATLESSNKSVLYISLGTMSNKKVDFYKECIKAFRHSSEWQVVMSVGKRINLAKLGEIPANFIVRASVPQLKLLEQVSVFITHGGMNSTMEALYNGVPLVVLPQMGEQQITAQQVAELGLGVTLKRGTRSKASDLVQAVQTIKHNPAYKQKAIWMQQIMREAGGYQKAAQEILQFKSQHLNNSESLIR